MLIFFAFVALAVATVMSGVAWRLAREEERRSEARLAALATELGTEPAPRRHPVVRLSAIAMAVVAVTCVGLVAGLVSSRPASSAAASSGRGPEARPLELLALGQTRAGDQLTVRGMVRNPGGAPAIERLAAVVLAYNDRGDFITSGRAIVEPPAVAAGAESTFTVTVAGASEATRYRVSFRDDNEILAHIDRRARTGSATIEP